MARGNPCSLMYPSPHRPALDSKRTAAHNITMLQLDNETISRVWTLGCQFWDPRD